MTSRRRARPTLRGQLHHIAPIEPPLTMNVDLRNSALGIGIVTDMLASNNLSSKALIDRVVDNYANLVAVRGDDPCYGNVGQIGQQF